MRRGVLRRYGLGALMAAGCAALCLVRLAPERPVPSVPAERALARVVEVDDSGVHVSLIVRSGEQFLRVRLVGGRFKGAELEAVNLLSGKRELDEYYAPGQLVFVDYEVADGAPANARARGVFRLHWQVMLVVLFGVLLLAVAGVTGLNALLSFVFAALLLWRVFLPLMLRGWPPLSTGLALTAALTAVITLAVGGVNRRGAAAFCGAMLGVLLTCGLAVLFTRMFRLDGAVRPFAETLLYAGYYELDLTRLFIAGVFIAASGAVMDLAMDVASAMDEIYVQRPEIGRWEHVGAGLRVGRAVIGTMTTTLLLAYSGGHMMMFMLFLARGLPLAQILNSPLVAAEVLCTLVGSFGLVTVAPFTALAAGLMYPRRNSLGDGA